MISVFLKEGLVDKRPTLLALVAKAFVKGLLEFD